MEFKNVRDVLDQSWEMHALYKEPNAYLVAVKNGVGHMVLRPDLEFAEITFEQLEDLAKDAGIDEITVHLKWDQLTAIEMEA